MKTDILNLFFNQTICDFDRDAVEITVEDFATVQNFNSRNGYWTSEILSECQQIIKLADVFTSKELQALRGDEFYEMVERPNADAAMALKFIGE